MPQEPLVQSELLEPLERPEPRVPQEPLELSEPQGRLEPLVLM